MEKHPLHIKNPELQTSPEVEQAVERQERQTGEKVPNDPAERIEVYMNRLENIFLNPDERKRERNLEMLRDKIYDVLIINRENFPESYFELQKRIARERGTPVEEISENVREQMKDVVIEDQRASLRSWMDYLSSNDAVYPTWFKYFVWKNIIKLSQFDKERGEFKKRTDSTVAPFPDIYREPLAQIADIYEKVKVDNKNLKEPEIREMFSKKFPTLYAELISKSLAAQIENREEVRGEWVKYVKGKKKDAEKLFQSLERKGTGWCTAGRSTAEIQIASGDFYVYYTNDTSGQPAQPRLAIRMEGEGRIGEVRGILPHQGVEPRMQEVLDGKLKEFGKEADVYRKKSKDMKLLTSIETKVKNNQPLTKDDLIFLYEINSPIEGFGYDRDPRIQELLEHRNPKEDALIVLECQPNEIAWSQDQISKDTKAYIGPLFKDVFKLENLEHIYTSFPEGKIKRIEVTIGGTPKEEFIQQVKEKFQVSEYAEDMLKSQDFTVSKTKEQLNLIRLTVKDLGFPNGATTEQIYKKAEELGLELCPAETGPQLRRQYTEQPLGEYLYTGMKQITDRDGSPSVFEVRRYGDELWLFGVWTLPGHRWFPVHKFVFRFRKLKT